MPAAVAREMLVVAFARKEGHSHPIQGPSAGQNGLLVRTAWDALRMCVHWLGHQHCGVRVLATEPSHEGDPSGTGFKEVVWRVLFSSNSSTLSLEEVQFKSENCNLATMERSNRRRIVPLQTLSTHDFDELAQAFPQWDVRFRQLGRARAPTQAGEQGSSRAGRANQLPAT
jgi:hypothetical protein